MFYEDGSGCFRGILHWAGFPLERLIGKYQPQKNIIPGNAHCFLFTNLNLSILSLPIAIDVQVFCQLMLF